VAIGINSVGITIALSLLRGFKGN